VWGLFGRLGLSAALLVALPVLADAQRFSLDLAKSELVVLTRKAGFAAGLAHDHVVRASQAQGELTWDPRDPRLTSVQVSVPVNALAVDEPEVRKRHGESATLSESERTKVSQTMLGAGQLDAQHFPLVRFQSTGVRPGGKDQLIISGELTLHGVTRKVSAFARITGEGGAPVGDCTFRVRTSDFGIKPFRAAFGAIQNQDEVTFVIHLVGAPQSQQRSQAPGPSPRVG
jgi:polyisoprenoid-binding protein YceI